MKTISLSLFYNMSQVLQRKLLSFHILIKCFFKIFNYLIKDQSFKNYKRICRNKKLNEIRLGKVYTNGQLKVNKLARNKDARSE